MEDRLVEVKSELERRMEVVGLSLEKQRSLSECDHDPSSATMMQPSAPFPSGNASIATTLDDRHHHHQPAGAYPTLPVSNMSNLDSVINRSSTAYQHQSSIRSMATARLVQPGQLGAVAPPPVAPRQGHATSIGSSPLSSHSASSRSATPRMDQSDNDCSV